MGARSAIWVLAVSLTLLLTGAAWAAGIDVTVEGAPTNAYQGETKTFAIRVAASGSVNIVNQPTTNTVTVNTLYTAGGGSTGPDDSSFFRAPTTIADGCTPKSNNPSECANTQNATGGPYVINASVAVPSTLSPGDYTVQIYASGSAATGWGLNVASFSLTVEEAPSSGTPPSVTIINPANGATHLVNEPLTAEVEIVSDMALTSVYADINGSQVSLAYNTESGNFEADIILTEPGQNSFYAEACNSAGCGSAESIFTVRYAWGGWLPPITTARFQRGRTLPVKFRINDYYGPTPDAIAVVTYDGVDIGQAEVLYDEYGVPYYQLNIKLDTASDHTVGAYADDGVTNMPKLINVK